MQFSDSGIYPASIASNGDMTARTFSATSGPASFQPYAGYWMGIGAGTLMFQTGGAYEFRDASQNDIFRIESNGAMVVKSVPPASAAAAGVQGTITWDASFIYICVATNTWKRVAIATW